jgi:hypothetical protein
MHSAFSSPGTVDLITHDPVKDQFVLIIVHSGEWDGSADEEESLLQKLNSYLHFALDGELAQRYPQATGKNVRLQIDSASGPPSNITKIISQADGQLMPRNIRVQFNLLR